MHYTNVLPAIFKIFRMDTYTQKLHFAKSLGYAGLAEAIGELGKFKFNDLFYSKTDVPIRMNGAKVIKVKQLKGINEKYYIYEDGICYSTNFKGKFLKPNKYQLKPYQKPHYAYPIRYNGKRRRLFIGRLVFFYFAEHSYKTIDDIPNICYVNENTEDYNIYNLKIAGKGEIIKKAIKNTPKENRAKIKATKSNLFIVESLLKRKATLKTIADIFGCSDMSVHRFIKRNNIKYRTLELVS